MRRTDLLLDQIEEKIMTEQKFEPTAFTDVWIRGLKPLGFKRYEIRDTTTTGLSIRVTASAVKTFVYNGRRADGGKVRITLGRYPLITLKMARDRSLAHGRTLAAGSDPRDERRAARKKAELDQTTLTMLLDEAEKKLAPRLVVWRKNGRPGRKAVEARAAIENVFKPLLQRPISAITADDLVIATQTYCALRPRDGKTTATGAVSRAMNYLRTVSNWASGRGTFTKKGDHRDPIIEFPDIGQIHDPSADDPTITGERERVLDQDEIAAVLPLLTFPAPSGLRERLDEADDYTPIALRFLFLTMSRIDEVASARRRDVDVQARTWTKKVKTRHAPKAPDAGVRRTVKVPLSDAAFELLCSLPSFKTADPDDLIFQSSKGGRLCNWDRWHKLILKESGTSGWVRHDMRATAATILSQFGVALNVIDTLLCHIQPLAREKVSTAAKSYVFDKQIIRDRPDPKQVAVNLLAQVLEGIVATSDT